MINNHLFCLWRYILHWASFNKFPEVEILWQRNLELTSISPHLMVFWIPHRFHHTEAELFLRGHNRTKHNAHTSPLSTCVVLNRTWTANTMMKTSNKANQVRECERNWHHFSFVREGSLHSSNVSHWIRKPECRSLKGIDFIVAFTWMYRRAHFFPSIF